MKCLLLHDPDPKYDDLLTTHNITPTNLTVLQTTILNINQPNTKYQEYHPDNFHGVIVTSKHGVRFLRDNRVDVSGKVVAVVGPSTVKLAREYCDEFSGVTVVWADNATELSQIIVTSLPKHFTWVFYCSSKALDIIPDTLSQNNISLKQLVVYQVEKRTELEQEVISLQNSDMYRAVVFFSPSGVEFTASMLSRVVSRDCVLVAFGGSTAKGIKQCFGDEYRVEVCERPTPNGVLDVLLKLI